MYQTLSRTASDTRLHGVIGPVVTNFDGSGDVLDTRAFAANVRAHIEQGESGVLVAGSTGEAALLDDDERATIIRTARENVPANGVLLAGIGAESTRQTIARARTAAECGADGVLVVAPHYYTAAMNRDALRAHFTAVADASPVPVLIYNIPKYTHLVLEPDLVAELADHPNVVGMKDSSGDMELLAGYAAIQRANPRFTVLTGHGPTFSTALRLGARGGILAVALFTGNITSRIFTAFVSGDTARADELQGSIAAAGKEIVGGFGVPGVKSAMDIVGLHGGVVRSPLRPLGEENRRIVAQLLSQLASAAQPAGV